jgi:glutamate synthase (NADPH/NADH) large chain
MTAGTVVILGKIGNNFAAGMTGGLAFIIDENSWTTTSTTDNDENIQNNHIVELDMLINQESVKIKTLTKKYK